MPEMVGVGSYSYVYGPTGTPTEQIGPNGSILYYLYNRQGSTIALADSSGHVVARYSYTPYGSLTCGPFIHPNTSPNSQPCHPLPPSPPAACPPASTNAKAGPPPCLSRAIQANHFLYDGQYQDTISGLYYLRARWYDPATGQFTSIDALVAITGEPYSYAGGDPTNAADILGLQTTLWLPSSLQQYESQWAPFATSVSYQGGLANQNPIWHIEWPYWNVSTQPINNALHAYYAANQGNPYSKATAKALTALCNAVTSSLQTLNQIIANNSGVFSTAASNAGVSSQQLEVNTIEVFVDQIYNLIGDRLLLLAAILPPSIYNTWSSGYILQTVIDFLAGLLVDS
jgi:RHS repeat-associated protein